MSEPMIRKSMIIMALLASTQTALAQGGDEAAGKSEMERGFSLLEEGTRLLLEGLMAEAKPAIGELEKLLGNLNAYHPPEVLPNGDIIIRRKEPLPVDPDGEIEL